MSAKLGYWKIRCLAQPIRLLLKYVGEEFEDIKYEMTDGPEFSREEWTSVKYSLGLEFPNLPYFIDGDVKLTQTSTILRYIAGKYDLLGKSTAEKLQCDMMYEYGVDLRDDTVMICYDPQYETLNEAYFKKLKDKLAPFENYLRDGRPWFAAQTITMCDFLMYETLDQNLVMDAGCLDDYPKLKAFHKRFEELPKIKEYMQSDRFMARPVNNKWAGFVGS